MSCLSRIVCLFARTSYPGVSSVYLRHFSHHYKILSALSAKLPTSNFLHRYQSTDSESNQKQNVTGKQLTQRQRLKQTFRDYGVTVVVFHVTISLASLGICYVAVSNGLDVFSLLQKIGFSESSVSNKLAVGSSTFVLAYAVHKLFAPVRMGITITAAPFIVRYLRSINILKAPKQK